MFLYETCLFIGSFSIGHPYIEVQHQGQNNSEMLADWLLDAELSLTKLPVLVYKGKPTTSTMYWHMSLKAEQVHYYCNKKYSWKHGKISCVQSTDDSDSCTGKFLSHLSSCIAFFSFSQSASNYEM